MRLSVCTALALIFWTGSNEPIRRNPTRLETQDLIEYNLKTVQNRLPASELIKLRQKWESEYLEMYDR